MPTHSARPAIAAVGAEGADVKERPGAPIVAFVVERGSAGVRAAAGTDAPRSDGNCAGEAVLDGSTVPLGGFVHALDQCERKFPVRPALFDAPFDASFYCQLATSEV